MKAETEVSPIYGTPVEVGKNIRRLLCPNPSPMTYHGTNTYIVGHTDLAVIDPGPKNANHLRALLACVGPDQHISHIIVTHSHLDHSPLAADLSQHTDAPVYAHGTSTVGRSAIMAQIAAMGLAGGGEGIDRDFTLDHTLADGEILTGSDWQLEVIHTPGHLGNHISLALGGCCFTGDHVMGWSSSLVSPPDGDLTDFMASCTRLQSRTWDVFLPGHGEPVWAPQERLEWLVSHRRAREASILEQLTHSGASAAQLARAIYVETPPALLAAAERNVFAHLVDLHQKNKVSCAGPLGISEIFRLAR
ncbi:MBL fold metallo-hydrolase [Epibacterium ulvae]|uniref:MBL fold metallo-hydrolase n=1 Tax=Epibacterium ulvae TaxID=1156985 RepID=UPI001BFC0E8A|nr:MBL fold metallo-hydrolase [Epibacterium ulvae]MBT8154580.1 MBL fold metallo-hydrolase [Epibacterium ulvae]